MATQAIEVERKIKDFFGDKWQRVKFTGNNKETYFFDAKYAKNNTFKPSGKSKYRFNVIYENGNVDEFRLPPSNPDVQNIQIYKKLMNCHDFSLKKKIRVGNVHGIVINC